MYTLVSENHLNAKIQSLTNIVFARLCVVEISELEPLTGKGTYSSSSTSSGVIHVLISTS